MYEKRGENLELYYYYDSFSTISGLRMVKDGVSTDYIFLTNWRGDVETIYDGTGTLQARYTYDAWGNVTSIADADGNQITDQNHIANVNPIRYRGYYQDAETGFYYLQSRYYDPVTHRFLNADDILGGTSDPQGYNVFAYAGNNPINNDDPDGHFWQTVKRKAKQASNWVQDKAKKAWQSTKEFFSDPFNKSAATTAASQAAHRVIETPVSKKISKFTKAVTKEPPKSYHSHTTWKVGRAVKSEFDMATYGLRKSGIGKATKAVSRSVGIVDIALLGIDVYNDSKRFNDTQLAFAIATDVLAFVAVAGATALAIGATPVSVAIFTMFAGVTAAHGADWLKDYVIPKINW